MGESKKRQKKSRVPSVFLLAYAEAERRRGRGGREEVKRVEGGCLIRDRFHSVTTHHRHYYFYYFYFSQACGVSQGPRLAAWPFQGYNV